MCVKSAREGGGKQTYESMFYHELQGGKRSGTINGFPFNDIGAWCKKLKYENTGVDMRRYVLSTVKENGSDREAEPQIVQYLGIAADEPLRIARHINKPGIKLPLVEAGWTEAMCREWCEQNDLLSPIYTDSARGGCWFCHNQSVGQLRLLRRNYPELWALLLKWDKDSPVSFKPDGHTVHDFDRRFQLEDEGFILPGDPKFRWAWLDGDIQMKWF